MFLKPQQLIINIYVESVLIGVFLNFIILKVSEQKYTLNTVFWYILLFYSHC